MASIGISEALGERRPLPGGCPALSPDSGFASLPFGVLVLGQVQLQLYKKVHTETKTGRKHNKQQTCSI